MPFKSEKQRRFLWAAHPEIAKRWAKNYPASNKDLPMYADKKDDKPESNSKAAAVQLLRQALVNNSDVHKSVSLLPLCAAYLKKADSKLEQIEVPQSDKPTYAGERQIQSILKPETEDEGSIGQERSQQVPQNAVSTCSNPLLSKLAVVLAPKIQQELENIRAEEEARKAQRVPDNVNVKQYPVVNNMVPPPMGMTAPPQVVPPAAPQAAQAPEQLAAVGGGSSPNANPINSFGGLSTNGDINGNAAFGIQNSMGGEKLAAKKCSCGCGDTTLTCKCPASCSCRQKGGSCYGLTLKKAANNNEILAQITGIYSSAYDDPAYIVELDDEMYDRSKLAAVGLWDRIRAKKKRGEKPAKPGDKDYPDSKSWNKVTAISEKQSGSPAWQRSAGKNEEGGLNEKGRKSYEREHGGNLKAPVTEKNPTGKAKKRRHSFCSRMCGMKRVNTGASTAKDPDSRINKSLRKWNCKCSSAAEFGHMLSEKLAAKQAQDFDPAMSRDAENAIMHGTGLVGSTALGTLAGLPLAAGLEQFAKNRNWVPDSEKNPFGYNLANTLFKVPMFVGGGLGLRLYDNYILRPHMRREAKQKEEELKKQILANKELAHNVLGKKAAEATPGRVFGTAAASVGGGLLLGSYPGWRLQRASENAGNHDFVSFVAGKAPIAVSGALSAALFNHLYDKYEGKKPVQKKKPEPETALKYVQYLVH